MVQTTTGASVKVVNVKAAVTAYDSILFTDNVAATTGTIGTSMPDVKLGFAGGTSAFDFGLAGDHVPLTDNTHANFQKGQFLMTAKEIESKEAPKKEAPAKKEPAKK